VPDPDAQPRRPPRDHQAGDLSETSYDVIVLGAGPTGENVADYAVRGGMTALLVESELVGGECSYWACMPSKALLRPVELVSEARAMPGVSVGPLDVQAVLARRDSFASRWDDSSQVSWADGAGIVLVRGHARITGEKQVSVDGVTLTARHAVVVATGSAAALPPIDGLAEAKPWTSREATSARSAPKRLAVLGGGVVGVEMAFAWQALGSQVTLLERGDRVLSNTEPEAGRRVTQSLRDAGVDVRTGVSASRVVRDGRDGTVTVTLDDGTTVEADEVLVAAGRRPRTDDLGLETIGRTPGDWLSVDDTMQVEGFDWLYAAGDVNHRALLTHVGKYQARVAGTVIAARAKGEALTGPWTQHAATADHDVVPQVVFSDPPLASVGLTEKAARAKGLPVTTVSYDLGSTAGGSLYADDNDGWAQLVVAGGCLVGATFYGPGVSEMVHAATVAIVGEVPLQRLWHAVASYPTQTEVWLRLLDQLPHG
jgi:pyruvate/2-oxoglutarate dehydrogenase complex dihydrolipoamide dehydrogenase (E3) component